MLILLLILFIVAVLINGFLTIIRNTLFRLKIINLLESISTKEDLVYVPFTDLIYVIAEVLRRKGYKVEITDKCGEEGKGLVLNDIQLVEIWKHAINRIVDVETAMNLAKCMQSASFYRGMLITLGNFKQNTIMFCHKNVIEHVNGEQLLEMCKEVQKKKAVPEVG